MFSKRSWLLAIFAVYGPFWVMSGYTLGYVACSHCKQVSLRTTPFGPGLILANVASHLFDLPRLSGPVWFISAFLISMTMVTLLAGVSHRWESRWDLTAVGLMLVLSSFLAMMTLALIRA